MPNHTINNVHMKGIAKKRLYSYNDRGEKYFDFNKLVPEPATREECPANYIDNGSRCLQHDDDKSWFNWYDWHCDFWGTKWNSYEFSNCLTDDEIVFWTAWTEPYPIWKALSKKYPKEKIYIRASYEDGLETESIWLGGERVSYNDWEDMEDEYD